jgi:RsiW-degrading membrane proteinase PrsW (M82 family)
MSRSWKQLIATTGALLALPGFPALVGVLCVTPLVVLTGERSAETFGLVSLVFTLMTLGAGGLTFWHSQRSLQNKPSKPMRLPSAWFMAAVFGLCTAAGIFIYQNDVAAGLFFPPLLIVAAMLPPLLAVSWFAQQQTEGLTWRRGLVAFAGGATVSVWIAIALEILLPVIVLALVRDLNTVVSRYGNRLLDALAGKDIASALTNPAFIYLFVEIAIIAPLAEEFAKPLVTLPLIGKLPRREAFLVAAMAGAGFAALENVLYASFGLYFWAGILVVRALGGAIHPLGAGLVGMSWRDVLNREPGAWGRGVARFGLAAGMHALWNGGSLIVITLAGARFFGTLVLGLAALWLGRAIVQKSAVPGESTGEPTGEFALSDRALAIWALACLAAIVPAGITGLQLLVR